ncbi:hypothetical protein GH5_04884 [Leishmania sp. Ghana 2012 LV757]|uniref:hypothetical protein n=1 Tax=Leishmania sp. Ghana 2012 LV757 TaxID=2803181 RepID=UPI001B5218B3|nr:hypothetical protein GH5_04884 [Leishmania sp. Ghana 2012 LV757]
MVALPEFVESRSLMTPTQHDRVSRNNATLAVPAVEQGDLVPKGGGTYVEALAKLGGWCYVMEGIDACHPVLHEVQ